MRERIVISVEGADAESRTAVLERARARGFRRFVVPSGVPVSEEAGEEVLLREADELRRANGAPPLHVFRIGDLPDLERLLQGAADGSTVVVEWTGDRIIPLENAIARRGRKFRLWTCARSAREVPAALGALEHGADAVIVSVRTPAEVGELETVVEGAVPLGLDWVEAPLRSIRPGGVGDRVLVDTTSLLAPEEGLLVGSSAAFLIHVASEAVGSKFSQPRPFRVNAGAAHSYVLMADGTTRYLSELGAGDAVLVTVPGGGARSVRVGRVKIERRPLVILSTEDGGRARTVFLQEAETVRVTTDRGRVAVTELAGDRSIRAVRLPPARHLGTAVEETIEER